MPRSYNQLLPSVERRLSTWVSLADKQGTREPQRTRPTITLSRRFGCEAFPLAERLRDLLDSASGEVWTIFDKALLERVSQDEHLSMELLENLGGPSRAADSIGFLFAGHQSHDDAFRRLAREIVRIAEVGNAIIVGRGGAVITQALSNCYHFRLDASTDYRVASIARRLELPEKDAQKMVREQETLREKFIEECLHASVADLTHYHAVFNNALIGVDEIARSIVSLVARQWPDKSYFKNNPALAGV